VVKARQSRQDPTLSPFAAPRIAEQKDRSLHVAQSLSRFACLAYFEPVLPVLLAARGSIVPIWRLLGSS
jgi:hypothetical protein